MTEYTYQRGRFLTNNGGLSSARQTSTEPFSASSHTPECSMRTCAKLTGDNLFADMARLASIGRDQLISFLYNKTLHVAHAGRCIGMR